jgi:predicted Zn-dependent protease
MTQSPPSAEMAELLEHLRALQPEPGISQAGQDLAYSMGFHWLQGGEFEKSRAAFETLWRACPTDARYAAGLAQSALGQGQAEVAAAHFMMALALDGENAGYMLGFGRALRSCGRPAHARLAMQIAEALAEKKDPSTAHLARACLALMGDA